ncbi:MAG: hypothetical protein WCY27_03255 [archaeon]|jgi:hypothetical protein|nr:hypothetical protein [archaeon]MDD2477445.1 hypothetical protein [Candidatus ainarchaeum sp.]MDD3084697.1 hypothetical protein [Candidatus ainarchaeum sp.]MDD4220976.1 hypothetical protein [Candidatus ainarchaeum sp.]MDD4662453.1 hypothetical protein [Candidatus ainarchaeum sp.]
MIKDNFKIKGFSKLEIDEKEYVNFLKNIKLKEEYLTLKKVKNLQIFLEIENRDVTKIKKTIAYIFYKTNNNLNLKISEIVFEKGYTKSEILKEKNKIVKDIQIKIEDLKYNLNPEDLLEFTRSKYLL